MLRRALSDGALPLLNGHYVNVSQIITIRRVGVDGTHLRVQLVGGNVLEYDLREDPDGVGELLLDALEVVQRPTAYLPPPPPFMAFNADDYEVGYNFTGNQNLGGVGFTFGNNRHTIQEYDGRKYMYAWQRQVGPPVMEKTWELDEYTILIAGGNESGGTGTSSPGRFFDWSQTNGVYVDADGNGYTTHNVRLRSPEGVITGGRTYRTYNATYGVRYIDGEMSLISYGNIVGAVPADSQAGRTFRLSIGGEYDRARVYAVIHIVDRAMTPAQIMAWHQRYRIAN